jgi:pectinesterase
VVVPKAKPYISLQGEGSTRTVLEWNDTASNVDLQGNLLTTYHSATVAVESHGFVARNLTFKVNNLV